MNKSTNRNNRACSTNKAVNASTNTTATNNATNNAASKRNMLKSVQCSKTKYASPTKKKEIVQKVQKKQFDLSEAIRVSRQKDIIQITKNVALLKYYNCLVMLFMTVFTSSQLIITNIFQKQHKTYPAFGFTLIDTLIKFYETTKRCDKQRKLKRLATNIMKIAAMPSQFERKVQFVSRKVVLNYEKKKQIQLSFMQDEIESFWQTFCKIIFISDQVQFMEDIFEFPSEKLCLKDFQYLLDNYLSTPLFQYQLQDLSVLQTSPEQNFTVQFLLIQKICLIQHNQKKEKAVKRSSNTKKCDIY